MIRSRIRSMNRPTIRSLAATLLLAVAITGCWVEPVPEEVRVDDGGTDVDATVRAALDSSARAWNAGDLEGFMAVYRQDSTTTYVGGPGLVTGYEGILERYAPLFEPGAERDSLRFEDFTVREIADGIAVGTARWVLHREGRTVDAGPFTLVLQRFDEGWRIVHDHSSSDPGPEPDESPDSG